MFSARENHMVIPNRFRQIAFGSLAVLLFVVALVAIVFGKGLVVPVCGCPGRGRRRSSRAARTGLTGFDVEARPTKCVGLKTLALAGRARFHCDSCGRIRLAS